MVIGLLASTALDGCGKVAANQREQQAVLRYEQRVGDVSKALASEPVTAAPETLRTRLELAVRRYRAVHAPAVMRPARRQLLKALRAEVQAVRDGLIATAAGDAAGIAAAQQDGARARTAAQAAFAAIRDQASECRGSLVACTPAGDGASKGQQPTG